MSIGCHGGGLTGSPFGETEGRGKLGSGACPFEPGFRALRRGALRRSAGSERDAERGCVGPGRSEACCVSRYSVGRWGGWPHTPGSR